MPLAQGSALWNLQRVFTQSRPAKESHNGEEKPAPSMQSTSFWKSSRAAHLFQRRPTTAPCLAPKRSTSAPHDFPLRLTSARGASSVIDSSVEKKTSATPNIISKSTSAPHTLKPTFPSASAKITTTSKSPDALPSDGSKNASQLELTISEMSPLKPQLSSCHQEPVLSPSKDLSLLASKTMSLESTPTSRSANKISPCRQTTFSSSPLSSPSKTPTTNSALFRPSSGSSSLKSSPGHSPLKSPSQHSSSRRPHPQSQQLPVTPVPPWSEILEARRRLLAVEGRRRALCALEMRVQQVHYVFIQAELRVARQRETLARLVEATGRAEVQASVHGQRIRKTLRKHKPRLLACALCVPWGSRSERRGGQHPRHTRCAPFQGRIQVLRGCVGGEDLGTRD